MLKLIEENAEGSGQIPQLPRKKEKRDFPVRTATLRLISCHVSQLVLYQRLGGGS